MTGPFLRARARASDRTQVLLMTVLAQDNKCTYVMINVDHLVLIS